MIQLEIDLGPAPKDAADAVFARFEPAMRVWFVRKPPGLRVRGEDVRAVAAALRDDGIAVRENVYEPEARRFGGTRAMALVHAFFLVDSRGFVAYHLHRARARLAPEVLSLAMVGTLFARLLADAGSEIWDAWANLAAMHGIDHRAVTAPLAPPAIAQLQPLATDHEAAILAAYDRGCTALAERIAALREDGDLHVGVRAFAADLALFHWNRWGIAHAARVASCEGALAALHPHRRLPCP